MRLTSKQKRNNKREVHFGQNRLLTFAIPRYLMSLVSQMKTKGYISIEYRSGGGKGRNESVLGTSANFGPPKQNKLEKRRVIEGQI
jgi:hypothetical protein